MSGRVLGGWAMTLIMGHMVIYGPCHHSPAIWLHTLGCIGLRTLFVNEVQTFRVMSDGLDLGTRARMGGGAQGKQGSRRDYLSLRKQRKPPQMRKSAGDKGQSQWQRLG